MKLDKMNKNNMFQNSGNWPKAYDNIRDSYSRQTAEPGKKEVVCSILAYNMQP